MRPSRSFPRMAALAVLAASAACATTSGAEGVASLRIARREGPGERWSDDRERPAAPPYLGPDRLVQALRDCTRRAPMKFMPRFRVTLVGRSGLETAFQVLGRRVKVHGISYTCTEDVEAIAAGRWGGGLGP